MNQSSLEIKFLSKALEAISKRLRKVEVLARPSVTSVDTFLKLNDTPSGYGGYRGFAVVVNPTQDGLTFSPFGSGCVTFECGPVGWRARGGTIPRTLVHEEAFQLSEEGNVRGAYAIDLQQLRGTDADVAAAEFSAILTNEENYIDPDAKWSTICGPYNRIEDWYPGVHILGQFNTAFSGTVYDGGYSNILVGDSHYVQDALYVFFAGDSNQAYKPLGGGGASVLGVFSFLELNEFKANAYDYPTYCGNAGIFNVMEGDVWLSFQWGEENYMYGLGVTNEDRTTWCTQFGFEHYFGNVDANFAFGQGAKSYRPTGDRFYDGRILLSGDYPNTYPSDGTGYIGGYNQDSWFSQNDLILNWTVDWITSRFQFPILDDSIWGFRAYILGIEQGAANSYNWEIRGTVKNDGGTTTILESIVTNNYRDIATKEWQVIADDANDRLVFQYRDTAGPDATDCNIQFSMFTVEVGWKA